MATCPSYGQPISLADLQNVFGGSSPASISEYYSGGGLVPVGTVGYFGVIPSSGLISLNHFWNASSFIPPIFAVNPNVPVVGEGSALTVYFDFISGGPLANGTVIPFTIYGTNVNENDFNGMLFSSGGGTFSFPSGTLNFVNGINANYITIPIRADGTTEGNETVTVQINAYNNPTGAFTITDDSTTPFVFDADYMVITYTFSDGRDLDTKTKVTSPALSGNWLGYAPGGTVTTQLMPNGVTVLEFGGDNTGVGLESVLVNLAAYKAYYGAASDITVSARCHWYATANSVGVQPVYLAATLYKGGTMVKDQIPNPNGPGMVPGFSWTNPTATGRLDLASGSKQITMLGGGGLGTELTSSQEFGTVYYNNATSSGLITVPNGSTGGGGGGGGGSLAGVISGGIWTAIRGTGTASVTFRADGTVTKFGTGSTSGNWYNPTTAGIGSGFYIRGVSDSGNVPLADGNWRTMTGNISFVCELDAGDYVSVYIANNPVGTGAILAGSLNLTSGTAGGGGIPP